MGVQIRRYTVEEFEQFVELPENADKRFEYIGGEIVEVPSNAYVSEIAARILGYLFIYLLKNKLGHLTGEGGGYMVDGERYAPDVAFISNARQLHLAERGYNPNPPELAVEVLSPSNDTDEIRIKTVHYLRAGTIIWIVNPEKKRIEVYSAKGVRVLGIDEMLDGGDVLPGFTLAVKDIFPE
jgi:Uma2 family endonuclease